MHVLGVTFVLEGELSYLSVFVVEGTRSIAIKLFSLHRLRCTTSEHHFLFVLSRLPSLCCVLLVFLSLDVLSVLGHQIIAIRCILLLTPVNSARLCELLWCLSDGVDTKEAHKDVHDVMWC